jgi:hypothetical protein
MVNYKVTVETGNYDEDTGYHGSNVKLIDKLESENEAIEVANRLKREFLGIPISEGYTVAVDAYEGKKFTKKILRVNTHPHNMTEEQRRAAKKARLKALRYETVKVVGEPKEGEVYYFKNGVMVNEQETSMVISQSRVPGIMHVQRPPLDEDEKILRGMLGRVGNEYFAKYYDKTPWDTK